MAAKLCFLLSIALFFGHSLFAQAKIYNETDKSFTLVYQEDDIYQEETISVPAFSHVYWDEAPSGNFIAYLYQTITTEPSLIMEKLGFVSLCNNDQLIIIDRTLQSLPVFIVNTGSEEFVLEYNRRTIFLQAGQSGSLEGLLLNLKKEAVVLVSSFNEENSMTDPKPIVLKFYLEKDNLTAFFEQ
jgi:hypothetical protein